MSRVILAGLSKIYSTVTWVRNSLFDGQILSSRKLPVPVVSIGNITAGGTGKSPMAIKLAQEFMALGKRPGIVSRGYGRKTSGVRQVEAESLSSDVGDEPLMIKQCLKIPVYVGESRFDAATKLLECYPDTDILILDDAFQHRHIFRDRDFVLVDLTQPLSSYEVLPLGLGRESVEGLNRASVLIFTKGNMPGAQSFEDVQSYLKKKGIHVSTQFQAHYQLGEFVAQGGALFRSDLTSGLVAGIGKPENFFQQIKTKCPGLKFKTFSFKDHHSYTKADLENIEGQVDQIVTTEKDFVKIKGQTSHLSKYFIAPLEVSFPNSAEDFKNVLVGISS